MVLNTESIYEDFSTQLLRFIRQRVEDSETAEDILQEVFLRIHNRIDTLHDESRVQSWIYQITRNAIIDHYRMRKNTVEISESLIFSEEIDGNGVDQELLPSVRQLITCLPEKYRQPLIMSEYRGLTQQEIADRLGLSLSGAKSRVQRAREKIKEMFLDCCHFELDRTGNIIDYYPRQKCCAKTRC